MDWNDVSEKLAAPLDPRAIKPPPQGKYGEYVDGLHVIREANRIFGFNGWSYTVERLERTHFDVVELQGREGPYKQLRTSYLCAVRVVVDGVVREGLAVGVGNGKPENAGDVIESAVKEAETDALKRALRTFGNTFGLALYDKDKSNREVGLPVNHPATRDRIVKALENARTLPRLQEVWQGEYQTAKALPDAMYAECEAAKDKRKAALTGPDPAKQAPEGESTPGAFADA